MGLKWIFALALMVAVLSLLNIAPSYMIEGYKGLAIIGVTLIVTLGLLWGRGSL